MQTLRCLFAILVVALSFATSTSAAEKIMLKLNFNKGDSRKLSYVMDAKSRLAAGDMNFDTNTKMGYDVTFKVFEVDAGGMQKMKFGYDRVLYKSQGFLSIDYDSDKNKEDKNPLNQIYSLMVGQSLDIEMKPNGKLNEIRGIDALAKKVDAKVPGGAAAIKHQSKNSKIQLSQMFAHFSSRPVGVGDSWNDKIEATTDPSMPIIFDVSYTLADRKNGIALVELDGKMVGKEAKITGTITGKLHIEERTGWTSRGDMLMKISGIVNGAKLTMEAEITIDGKK